MGRIGKGAEAELHTARFSGMEVVVKDRIAKAYRIKEIDIPLRKARTRTEARLISAAKKALVSVPVIYHVDDFSISMNRVRGKLLRDSRMSPRLLRTAGEYLARLHANNIVHGDYTAANLMVDSRGRLYVIDFGLGSFSRDLEDKAVDVLLMKKSLGDKRHYGEFLNGYRLANKEHGRVLRQLEEVEKRGRYVVRAMQA